MSSRRHLLLIGALALMPSCVTLHWDGLFPCAEYQLRFVTEDGAPVPGVTLRVLAADGTEAIGLPVTNHVSDAPLRSDADGWLVLRQAHAMRFGGDKELLFGFLTVWSSGGAPRFELLFLHRDRVVHRVKWVELVRALGYESTVEWEPGEHVPLLRQELQIE